MLRIAGTQLLIAIIAFYDSEMTLRVHDLNSYHEEVTLLLALNIFNSRRQT